MKPLDMAEVKINGGASSGGKTGKLDRRLKVTSCHYAMTHTPTGITVRVEVPPGHYSKKQMRTLREKIYRECIEKLTESVGKRK